MQHIQLSRLLFGLMFTLTASTFIACDKPNEPELLDVTSIDLSLTPDKGQEICFKQTDRDLMWGRAEVSATLKDGKTISTHPDSSEPIRCDRDLTFKFEAQVNGEAEWRVIQSGGVVDQFCKYQFVPFGGFETLRVTVSLDSDKFKGVTQHQEEFPCK